jgi:hypothetical protein
MRSAIWASIRANAAVIRFAMSVSPGDVVTPLHVGESTVSESSVGSVDASDKINA